MTCLDECSGNLSQTLNSLMKRTFKTLSLVLAFAGISIVAANAQSTRLRPVHVEGIEVRIVDEDPTPAGTHTDADFPFLASIRGWKGPEAFDTYSEFTGRNDVYGWYNKRSHNIYYVTEILLDAETGAPVLQEDGSIIPLKVDVYVWTELSYFSGERFWGANYVKFDFATQKGEGYWWGYDENDPSSAINGAGSVTVMDLLDGTLVADYDGWVLAPVDERQGRGRHGKIEK